MLYLQVRMLNDGWGRDPMGMGRVTTEDLGETISTIPGLFHDYSLQSISTNQSG
jgi:hypothetical protein